MGARRDESLQIQKIAAGCGCSCDYGVYPISQRAIAEAMTPSPGSVFRNCSDCPEMVVVPAGKFIMGSSPEEANRDIEEAPIPYAPTVRKVVLTEQPQHEVAINLPFALAKYPVTKNEFGAFVEETGYMPASGCVLAADNYRTSSQANWRLPGFVQTEQDPVVCVNWQDAKAYIGWLNKKLANSTNSVAEGSYRLPSEAEWEYAARAGTRTARWWGNSIGRNNAVCARCGSKWDQTRTAPVGSFPSNPFGLYDMLGNVSQWTEDCWNESYTAAPVDGRPWETGNCDRRLARGGDWMSFPWVLRSATRSGSYRDHRYNSGGFRVAKTLLPSLR